MAAWNSETVCMEELEYSSVPRGINLVGTPYLSSRFFGMMAGRVSRAYIHRPKNHASTNHANALQISSPENCSVI